MFLIKKQCVAALTVLESGVLTFLACIQHDTRGSRLQNIELKIRVSRPDIPYIVLQKRKIILRIAITIFPTTTVLYRV